MEWLTAAALRYNRVTYFLMLVIVLAGTTTYFSQPSQEDPEITLRKAKVITQFPGMAGERMEQLITKPLEEAIKQMPEVITIESRSSTGQSDITVEVGPQYTELDSIWNNLRNKVDDAQSQLPDGTYPSYVNDDFGRVAVATLALSGADFSAAELASSARHLRDRFSALSMVSAVDLYGIQDERVWLEIEPAVLLQLGISTQQLTSAIRTQNVILPGGSLLAHGHEYFIEPSGNFDSIDEIADVPISIPGRPGAIYLRDVVTVKRDYVDPPQKPAFFNGQPAVVIALSMVKGRNIADFGLQLDQSIAQVQALLPLGMQLDKVTYQPPLVATAVKDATVNLFQTIATVLAVVMIFLGVRTGAIVGTMVPLTILAALIGMNLWDIPLHRISIAAIIIALGLLVDNGIVIAEDIAKRLHDGEERLAACLASGRSLSVPLLTSSLTTILAFLPLLLAEDTAGEFVRALSQVMILALLSSWFLAITVTPSLCYLFLRPNSDPSDGSPGRFTLMYDSLLQRLLALPLVFILAMLMLLATALYGLSMVTPRLMPSSDRAQYVVHLELPAGASTQATLGAYQRLAEWLNNHEQNPEIRNHVAYIASGGPRFFLALAPVDPVPHRAFLVVNTDTGESVESLLQRTTAFIAEQIPEARGRAEKLFLGATQPGTVELRIIGSEVAQLSKLGQDLEQVFRQVPGISATKNDWMNPVLKIRVEVDQIRARRAGITSEDVARALSSYFDGMKITDYREGEDVIPVYLRADENQRRSLDDLRSLAILSSSTGAPVPLVQVADLRGAIDPFQIRRYNQERAITISALHPNLQAAELYEKLRADVEQLSLPFGYRLELHGEIKASQDANGALFKYFPHCLVGILALLIAQFNSLRRPLIIMTTIPLVLIGASAGLLITGAFLDFVAMLGLLSLAGIIINNGIVLIDRIDQERDAGLAVADAIRQAAQARLRPILMTTLTTILGLMPLNLFGGEFWYAMTIVIMFGLAVGTVLTLGFVPALYMLLFSRNQRQPVTAQ